MEWLVVHKITCQGRAAKVRGRVTCWQFNDCSDMLRNNCPAYNNNAGRSCWNIQGTLCALSDQVHKPQPPAKCHHCEFFIQIHANLI